MTTTLTVKAAIDALASHAQTDQDLLTSTRDTIGMDSPTQSAVTIPENASCHSTMPQHRTPLSGTITTRNAPAAQASEATSVRSALGAAAGATHLGAFAAAGTAFSVATGLTAKARSSPWPTAWTWRRQRWTTQAMLGASGQHLALSRKHRMNCCR